MKNLYQKIANKFLFAEKNLIALGLKWLNALKKDFSFHNKNTELLAIWTILFLSITGLFILAIRSNVLIIFLFLVISVATMFLGVFVSIYYLHALKYHNKKRLLPKIHNTLNISFKLRHLPRFIKIPHISILSNFAKNFKLAS